MIKIIYGKKGTGKTNLIIDDANNALKNATGKVIFVTDNSRCMYELKREVNFININEYEIAGEEKFSSFIKGVVAGNSNDEYLFIDGVARICGVEVEKLEKFFDLLNNLSEKNNVSIEITCSVDRTNLPDFFKKYINTK